MRVIDSVQIFKNLRAYKNMTFQLLLIFFKSKIYSFFIFRNIIFPNNNFILAQSMNGQKT